MVITAQPPYGTPEYYAYIGKLGGQKRAQQPGFKQHQSRAGKRSAAVNDMAALGHRGAMATMQKYGYWFLFEKCRAYRLANPSRPERKVMAILDELGYTYEREALVLGSEIPVAVDFYLPTAGEAVIEVYGRVHYDPLFDHPNKPLTRRASDMHRVRRIERAGFRVLEIDYQDLQAYPFSSRSRIINHLMN